VRSPADPAALAAPGMVSMPGADAYPTGMDMITDPGKLPADRKTIADDTLINQAVWAALQGVELGTVYSNTTRSNKRRAAGNPKAGDMPAADETAGQTPMWRMSSYRRWEAARPGMGAGAGRPRGSARGSGPRVRRPRVELPISCPHCKHEITAADLVGAKAAARGAL
jgi:hypothetical protein